MTGHMKRFVATGLVFAFLAGVAHAQQLRIFESKDALDAEIERYMSEGSISALVDAVAPPSRMSGARIRFAETAVEGDAPSLTQHVPIFESTAGDAVSRGVTAWWDGETYVFVGLLTHSRDNDLVVLDFMLTTDVRNASRWFLTGSH